MKKLYAIYSKRGLHIQIVPESGKVVFLIGKENAEKLAKEFSKTQKIKFWVEEVKVNIVKNHGTVSSR